MVQGHLCRPAWVASCRWECLVPTFHVAAASSDTRLMRWQLRRWWGRTVKSWSRFRLYLWTGWTQLERVVEQIAGAPVPQILDGVVEGAQHAPEKRVQNSVVEQIGGVPVPQIWEPIVDGPYRIPRECVQNRTPEQTVDVLVPQITEDGLPIVPQERVHNRVAEQIVDVLVPQITEDGLHLVPQERVQNRTSEQIVDVLVPQIVAERVQHRTQEQIADVLVPPIMEAVLPCTPQERVQNLTQEQVMDVPVPQNMGDYAGVVRAIPQERQTTKEIGDGVQHVPSKRMPQRHGDCNIKGLDKYNMPCAGVVSDRRPLSRAHEARLRGFRASPLGFEAENWESVYCGDASSACPPGLP